MPYKWCLSKDWGILGEEIGAMGDRVLLYTASYGRQLCTSLWIVSFDSFRSSNMSGEMEMQLLCILQASFLSKVHWLILGNATTDKSISLYPSQTETNFAINIPACKHNVHDNHDCETGEVIVHEPYDAHSLITKVQFWLRIV